MVKYNWNYPTTMWVGENRINDIAIACESLGITRPLLVTDKGLAKTDIVKNTLLILKEKNIVPTTKKIVIHFFSSIDNIDNINSASP